MGTLSKKTAKFTEEDLSRMQALPLDEKIRITQTRILEWIMRNGAEHVAVSFSGGKDSTVLLDLVRRVDPSIIAIFADTGLEFPEVREFALSKPNVVRVRPEMIFRNMLVKYGYPLISKDVATQIEAGRGLSGKISEISIKKFLDSDSFVGRDGQEYESWFNIGKYLPLLQLPFLITVKCCDIIKERPIKKYQKEHGIVPIVGTMADESRRRKKGWLNNGCNAFDLREPRSMPLGFWTEQDILNYIRKTKLEIPSVYGEIVPDSSSSKRAMNGVCLKCTGRKRTGCIFCCFGAHHEVVEMGESRFQQLAKTHPKLYDYCMRGGKWADNPYYDATKPIYSEYDRRFTIWNPKKIWVPTEDGLGYKVMLDMVNSVYGKNFIPY